MTGSLWICAMLSLRQPAGAMLRPRHLTDTSSADAMKLVGELTRLRKRNTPDASLTVRAPTRSPNEIPLGLTRRASMTSVTGTWARRTP